MGFGRAVILVFSAEERNFSFPAGCRGAHVGLSVPTIGIHGRRSGP